MHCNLWLKSLQISTMHSACKNCHFLFSSLVKPERRRVGAGSVEAQQCSFSPFREKVSKKHWSSCMFPCLGTSEPNSGQLGELIYFKSGKKKISHIENYFRASRLISFKTS